MAEMRIKRLLSQGWRPTDRRDLLRFTCNICGARSTVLLRELGRESNSCSNCLSIVRWRSIIAALAVSLFGQPLPLDKFPINRDIVGLGMSDWDGYAERLASVFDYKNTFYDEPPKFDVMAPLPPAMIHSYDFVISSDVLEHVAPPYQQALNNLHKVLKPGGTLIVTVPLKPDGVTDEHYPNLHKYSITIVDDTYVLVNRTRAGTLEVFDNLIFHGGPGATLEMRLLSFPDLLNSLQRAGFVDVEPFEMSIPAQGIVWNMPCGWPIIARTPGSTDWRDPLIRIHPL